jgi:hypothetical protein
MRENEEAICFRRLVQHLETCMEYPEVARVHDKTFKNTVLVR